VLFLLAISVPVEASEVSALPAVPSDWHLAREHDGVETFERPFAGSPYAEVRAVVALCAKLPAVLAYVRDADRFREWVPDTVEARVLDVRAPEDQIYYVRSGLPWPMKDRDMIYRLRAAPDPVHPDEVVVSMEGLPDLLPPRQDAVRMAAVSGRWRFRERARHTDVVLEMHIDPGGAVPPAVARRRILGMPGRMLANLAARFERGCRGRQERSD
jgi:hypothetical protein